MENNLRKLRKEMHMTQEKLASFIGATKRQIGAWERGENDLPLDYAHLIADVFNCSLDELAGRDDYLDATQTLTTSDEQELLALYRRMEPAQKLAIMEVARSMAVASEKDGARNYGIVEMAR